MSLVWSSGYNGIPDPDAQVYIAAVEQADGQPLENEVAIAIHEFVSGCKYDGIWDAIKASCILAGARTLSGTLVPLTGAAPTNFNFVADDYNRKTGLAGNGTTKYLDSNRNNNADPQNDRHLSVWVNTTATFSQFAGDIGFYAVPGQGNSYIGRSDGSAHFASSSELVTTGVSNVTGFRGVSRNASSSFNYRASSSTLSIASNSITPASGNILVLNGGVNLYSNARLAFYSIGAFIDLALLDARVTTLINTIGAVLP